MARISKKRKDALAKIDSSKVYSLAEACNLVKEISSTKFDASISSGLAIMACNKNKYAPVAKRVLKPMSLGIKKYNNDGFTSKIIQK